MKSKRVKTGSAFIGGGGGGNTYNAVDINVYRVVGGNELFRSGLYGIKSTSEAVSAAGTYVIEETPNDVVDGLGIVQDILTGELKWCINSRDTAGLGARRDLIEGQLIYAPDTQTVSVTSGALSGSSYTCVIPSDIT